jgi:phospholipase/carboxylesterase
MQGLAYAERLAYDGADGLLILHHGRGTDEQDLLVIADVVDRAHRMHVVAPRAPLTLPGWEGYHWYSVPEVGYPDHDSFHDSYARLCAFHDDVWRRTEIPPSRTVLGGFSMGCVMTYATGLGPGRPRPAGILAFSGFIPTVDGWHAELESRSETPVLIAHGRTDQIVGIDFARHARATLSRAGFDVTYHETGGAHLIDESALGHSIQWLGAVI